MTLKSSIQADVSNVFVSDRDEFEDQVRLDGPLPVASPYPVTVRALVDFSDDVIEGANISTERTVFIPTASLPATPAAGDQVVVGGRICRVVDVLDDGFGMTKFTLHVGAVE